MCYETIRSFETARFAVIVDATYDDYADMSYMDADEFSEFCGKGGASYLVRVRVMLDGVEIASNYLGGCDYYNIHDFQDHRECGRTNREFAARGERGRCGSYFADMIRRTIADARQTLRSREPVRIRAAA